MKKYILVKKDSLTDFQQLTGGKCFNSEKMVLLGINVPEYIALTFHCMEDFIIENQLTDPLNKLVNEKKFDQINKLFTEARFNIATEDNIFESLRDEGLLGSNLAVRSSGLDEDGILHSFAGLFSSYLYQEKREDIVLSIKLCWASAYSERAIAYRIKNEMPIHGIKMGILIQRMINSDTAGVMFTQNPIQVTSNKTVVIEGLYGQGEGLVSGEFDADNFIINKETFGIIEKLANKPLLYKKCATAPGIEKISVETGLQDKSSVEINNLILLTKIGIDLEIKTSLPLDIEWAIENNKIYILQMRPITTLPPAAYYNPEINGREPILWDNSNIVESFNGVTTPLTFSGTRKGYAIVYRQTCRFLGVPEKLIQDHDYEFNHMLGMIQGRVYYNLINWYKLLCLVPGNATNQGFMETMMGVKEELHDKHKSLFDFVKTAPKYTFFQKINVATKLFINFRRINKTVDEFLQNFENIYQEKRSLDFKKQSLPQLVNIYSELETKITHNWMPPIINDILVMIFFGICKKLTEKWILGDNIQGLQNDLLCGEGGLESTMPTKFLMGLADKIDHGDPAVRELFLATHANSLWNECHKNSKLKMIFEEMNIFLDKYGFRCSNEQKLEENDLTDDPSFALSNLQSYIKMKTYSIKDMEEKEKKIRSDAETKVKTHLGGIKLIIYFWVLKHTRNAVKNRENLRFARTKSFGLYRRLFREIGVKFRELDLIENEKDIFYLYIDEILDSTRGCLPSLEFKNLIDARKKEFEKYRQLNDPPERFITYGSTAVSFKNSILINNSDLLKDKVRISDDPNLIYGTSCSPGVVEGIARVVKDIHEAQGIEGEILVTYRTDPGWVPLYPSCKGLIIERGSLLSHSAVVARELGLPTIVGVHGDIFKKIKTGDFIILDATRGEIRINVKEKA